MIRGLQGGSDPHDLCSIKIASNLIVSLLLGGELCKCKLNVFLYTTALCECRYPFILSYLPFILSLFYLVQLVKLSVKSLKLAHTPK